MKFDIEYISKLNKEEIIQFLVGKEFMFEGKLCTMDVDPMSKTVWLSKKGLFFGYRIIQAHRLLKVDILSIIMDVYDVKL